MKILLVSTGSGSRGGGEIFLDYLGKGLTERGHEVLVWIPKHARMDELAAKCARFARVLRADYRNTYDYPGRSLSTSLNWSTSRRIAREWKALRPDVIHINKQNLEDGLDLLHAVQHSEIPSVCTIHLTQTAHRLRAKAAWLRDRIARRALSRYRGVLVAVQEARRRALDDLLTGRTRTQTIFNGVPIPIADPAALRPMRDAKRKELGLTNRDFLVLGVGRLVEQKRPFRFLDAAQELHSRFPLAKFLWVGDGDLAADWRERIRQRNLEGLVIGVGWQDDVRPFLLAADLLLHVAQYEGFPLSIIEAMGYGLPCAVTRDLASEIPLLNDANTLLADDLSELAEKIQQPDHLRTIAASARRSANHSLSTDAMAGGYEGLYAEAVNSGGAKPAHPKPFEIVTKTEPKV